MSYRPAEVYRPTGNVYTRIDNHQPASGTDSHREEHSLESQLLDLFTNTSDLSAVTEATQANGHHWPIRYHLSVQRANLLRPFVEYFPHKKILEVGSDCGVLTRFLGECHAQVIALETNFWRAEITAERCRDLDLVTVINEQFAQFESDELFDVIVIAGGLDDTGLLQKANNLLKEDGLLLLALDNKLGLKYWAGIPENHTGLAYAGIENRHTAAHPFLYGKVELQGLLQDAGFAFNEFYFPFPDYKFPAVILKDKALQVPELNVADLLLSNLDYVQNNWYPPGFSLERAIRQVISNGLTDHLANSFLVIAQKKQQAVTDEDILAWVYSAQRKKPYRKENIFLWQPGGTPVVEKKKMYPQEREILFAPIQQHIHNEPYIKGDIYFLQFIDIISTPGWSVNQLVDWAFPYYKLLLSLSQQQGNERFLNGNYVDLTPFNILVDKQGHLHVFDQEWQVNERVPLSFVLFRGLYYCLAKPLSFYLPQPQTPLFAFELIQKIVDALFTAPANMVQDFIEREQAWFSAISLFDNKPPQNFQLNISTGHTTGPVIRDGIIMTPLQTIRSKAYLQTATVDFSEQLAFEQIIELTPEQRAYSIRIDHPIAQLQKIRLDLAEQPGIIQLHTLSIKDDKGHILLYWDGNEQDDIELTDTLLIKEGIMGPDCHRGRHGAKACLLLSNDPMIIFTLPDSFQYAKGHYCTIELELSAMEQSSSEALANNMSNLLPLLRFSAGNRNGTPAKLAGEAAGIRKLITTLVQDVAKPLEAKIAVSNHEITLLEEQMAEKEKEIEGLQKAVQQYAVVAEENSRLKRTVDWFIRTYELRSLPGILKDRLVRTCKKIYRGILNRLIETPFIQRKYAAAYLLIYARDNGPWRFSVATLKTIKEHGFGSITQAKSIIRGKLRSQPNRPLFTVKKPAEEVIDRRRLKQEISGWEWQPKISIILPVYNTKPMLLQAAIESVQDQAYGNWELCIVDDASTQTATREMLASFEGDPRINIQYLDTNAGISQASNKAIQAATGEFIALMDHDDELTFDALFWVVKEIHSHNNVDIIYTDECKVDEHGQLSEPFRKPAWSPELLLNMMYPAHLTVYRTPFLLNEVGLFRKQYDFSQDYDLMLRASEKAKLIRHIPRILYHWRMTEGSAAQGDKPYARQTNLAALSDAMRRRGIDADLIELPTANRVKLKLPFNNRVSLIIPTDSYTNLQASLESITGNTAYPNYEIVVVTNSGLIATMQQQFAYTRVKYVPYDMPYNFSDKCNVGVDHASGEIVIFFNDDVRPLQADWIENTIEYLWLPGVGGVSPKLLYENDTIQYAGMCAGVRNLNGTIFHCYPKDSVAYFNFPQSVRNVSILSGACMAMRKTIFNDIGGFDHINTPSAHSDVDLSFKLMEQGLRCVYTPYAVLRHIGHLSLADHEKKEIKKDKADLYLLKRWAQYIANDPYFTKPMRDLLYHDSPEPFTIYAPVTHRKYGNAGDIMLICHDLTLSGAPIMLYDICKILLANGYFVTVCCATDGPLRIRYQQLGVPVIVDEVILEQQATFFKFAKNFDAIICNTVVTWPIVMQMQQTVRTIWWLQEAQVIRHYLDNSPEFIKALRQAKNVITVSDYSTSFIKEYNPRYTKIHNACADFCGALEEKGINKAPKETLIFSIVGSIEHRKGQDVLIDALNYLDDEVLQRIEVHIVGRTLDEKFRDRLNEKIKHKDCVRFLGELSHEDSISYLYGSDVIISASRDDPFPVVLVEALCMGKTCIVSDRTGLAELINDGRNGLVFPNENARALAKKITHIARDASLVQRIGAEARVTYEKYLTLATFEKKLLNYLNNIPESLPKPRKPETRLITTLSEG